MTQPRVHLRKTADADTRLAAIYHRVIENVGAIPAMYQALGHAPEVLDAWIGLGWGLRSGSTVDRALLELAILRVAQLTDSDYVWRSHWMLARKAGVVDTKLRALGRWAEHDDFSQTERSVLALTDALATDVNVGEADWSKVAARFDERQRVELVMTIAWYCCVARVASGLAVPLDAHHERVPGLNECL
jgi:AhpD family alkylhydroperoxidase